MGPHSRCIGPIVPPPQPWQVLISDDDDDYDISDDDYDMTMMLILMMTVDIYIFSALFLIYKKKDYFLHAVSTSCAFK